MNIQEIAKLTGLSKDTIRYYEKIGLINPERSKNQYRVFSQFDLEQLKMVAVLQYAQFDLKSINTIINSFDKPASDACHQEISVMFQKKGKELTQKIADYKMILEMLGNVSMPQSAQEYSDTKDIYRQETMNLVSKVFDELQGGNRHD